AIGLQIRQRDRVVHAGMDAALLEPFPDVFPVLYPDHVEVKDVPTMTDRSRGRYAEWSEQLEVETGDVDAARGPARKVRELRAEHGCLQIVEAAVVAFELMIVLGYPSVVGELPDPGGQRVVVRDDRPCIAVSAEV